MPDPRRLRNWLEQGWYASSPRLLLRPLAALHGCVLRLRAAAYRRGLLGSRHAGVPTIVVGNVTVGGTGKTPLVIWLARALRAQGRRPGVMLRGYGGSQRAAHRVTAGDDAAKVGDEALLLQRLAQCPVAVGAARIDAARLLADAGCDVLIADDGLQHLALRRDLEVLVVDGARGFGNGALLPAGPRREAGPPWPGRTVVLHGEDATRALPPGLRPLRMHLAPVALSDMASGRELPLQSLRGETLHAVAGIGHPARFFALLRSLGATPIEHPFPDHHAFDASDLRFADGRRIVMTEKDAVRCGALAAGREDLLQLAVEAVLPQEDAAKLLALALDAGRK